MNPENETQKKDRVTLYRLKTGEMILCKCCANKYTFHMSSVCNVCRKNSSVRSSGTMKAIKSYMK